MLTVPKKGKAWYLIEDNSTAADAGTVTLLAKECVDASQYDSGGRFVEYSSNPTVKTAVDSWYTNNISTAAQAAVSGSRMFLLTKEQATPLTNAVRECSLPSGTTDNINGWWLCSQGHDGYGDAYLAAYVDGANGYVYDEGLDVEFYTLGVRPALKLDLSKVTFDSTSKTFTVGAAETSETLLTTITRNDSGAVYFVSGRATLSTSGNVKDAWDPISDVHGWVNSSQQIGSVTITAEAGYTITKVVFWDYDVEDGYCNALTDNASPFT